MSWERIQLIDAEIDALPIVTADLTDQQAERLHEVLLPERDRLWLELPANHPQKVKAVEIRTRLKNGINADADRDAMALGIALDNGNP